MIPLGVLERLCAEAGGSFNARWRLAQACDEVTVAALTRAVRAAQEVVAMVEAAYPELLTDPDWPDIPNLVAALAPFVASPPDPESTGGGR